MRWIFNSALLVLVTCLAQSDDEQGQCVAPRPACTGDTKTEDLLTSGNVKKVKEDILELEEAESLIINKNAEVDKIQQKTARGSFLPKSPPVDCGDEKLLVEVMFVTYVVPDIAAIYYDHPFAAFVLAHFKCFLPQLALYSTDLNPTYLSLCEQLDSFFTFETSNMNPVTVLFNFESTKKCDLQKFMQAKQVKENEVLVLDFAKKQVQTSNTRKLWFGNGDNSNINLLGQAFLQFEQEREPRSFVKFLLTHFSPTTIVIAYFTIGLTCLVILIRILVEKFNESNENDEDYDSEEDQSNSEDEEEDSENYAHGSQDEEVDSEEDFDDEELSELTEDNTEELSKDKEILEDGEDSDSEEILYCAEDYDSDEEELQHGKKEEKKHESDDRLDQNLTTSHV